MNRIVLNTQEMTPDRYWKAIYLLMGITEPPFPALPIYVVKDEEEDE